MILFFGIILTLIGLGGLAYGVYLKNQVNKNSMSRLFYVTSLIICAVGLMLIMLSIFDYLSS